MKPEDVMAIRDELREGFQKIMNRYELDPTAMNRHVVAVWVEMLTAEIVNMQPVMSSSLVAKMSIVKHLGAME